MLWIFVITFFSSKQKLNNYIFNVTKTKIKIEWSQGVYQQRLSHWPASRYSSFFSNEIKLIVFKNEKITVAKILTTWCLWTCPPLWKLLTLGEWGRRQQEKLHLSYVWLVTSDGSWLRIRVDEMVILKVIRVLLYSIPTIENSPSTETFEQNPHPDSRSSAGANHTKRIFFVG